MLVLFIQIDGYKPEKNKLSIYIPRVRWLDHCEIADLRPPLLKWLVLQALLLTRQEVVEVLCFCESIACLLFLCFLLLISC